MTSTIVAAIVGGIATFAFTYLLKIRDERRLGGAAEREVRAELTNAWRLLGVPEADAAEAWKTGGLQIGLSAEQWERLISRLAGPASWDRLSRASTALRLLQRWAESDASERGPLDEEAVRDARAEVESVLLELAGRERGWLRWRPWLRAPDRRPDDPATALEDRHTEAPKGTKPTVAALLLAAVVALLGAATWGIHELSQDPIDAGKVEAELRELMPDAEFVDCTGSDSADRWTCVTATDSCKSAASHPRPCDRAPAQESVERARGSEKAKLVLFDIIKQTVARPEPDRRRAPRKSAATFVGHLNRADPPLRGAAAEP